ncbi:MAG: RNA polymerase factor sigma-32 [Thermodesulfobacteriota bacterium]|nr:RNA polymerase factor sigma-32 [Thermodesulfobacteriota bacterium]|tara:strand:+ start:607 stop:1506 length:900 start_codon:yes stop_codon:yes gene_type:complete
MDKKKKKKAQIINQNSNLPVPANSLEKYLTEISNYHILSREEEYDFATKYRESGDIEAARKLITSNLRFVVKIATEYKNYGLNLMDIIQEGNLGLMQAVTKFDPTKRYRLISYGVWWIRAYIQNFIMKNWSLVKIGTTQSQRKLFYKIRSAKSLYNAGDISQDEYYQRLSEDLKISIKEIKEMDIRMGGKDFSLDEEIKAGEHQTKIEFLESGNQNQEDIVLKQEQNEELNSALTEALDILNDREKYIIQNRIISEDQLTLEEIGEKFKISRERVRQIEKTAISKIKKILLKRNIKADF